MARPGGQGDHNAINYDNMDVFDDEYEIDEFDGIADGFRPSQNTEADETRMDFEPEAAENEEEQQDEEVPIQSISAHYAQSSPAPEPVQRLNRSSIRKSRAGADNPFASPHDDAAETTSQLGRTASIMSQSTANFAPGITHRSISSGSNNYYARSGSPAMASFGPSHPYSMYPQGTVLNSPTSMATSTRPYDRASMAVDGPAHPYGMYPQGVGEEDDLDDDEAMAPAAPVGFPGLGQSYQRRRGPEGEEQDIVGEDGHAEQLPPYTRYPEDGPEKMPLLSVPLPLHSRGPVAGTDPGMPLMHEQSRPSPQSMSDATNIHQAPEAVPMLERMETSTDFESSTGRRSWNEKSWREKKKTRICGVPFWWIVLGAGVCVFVTVVLGGAIGGILSVQKKHHG